MTQPHASKQTSGVSYFSNGLLNKFSQARTITKPLSDKELDSYIDNSVAGADRKLAHELMRAMPPRLRGDFVAIDSHHHLVTNNLALLPYVEVHSEKPSAVVKTPHATASLQLKNQRRTKDYISSCSPLNPPSSPGGPYVRQVSLCGFTAGFAFVNVQCGVSSFASTDVGHLYMELKGRYGSMTEGGLQYNNDLSVQPYTRANDGTYLTMNNRTAHYTCGQDLGVLFGATSSGSYTYTSVGIVPCSPEAAFCGGSAFTFTNEAWLFASAPGDITGGGNDGVGVLTPCTVCSISRVSSIAQKNVGTYSDDGSYFGVDQYGNMQIHWMQVAFGEWLSDCAPGTSLCTGVYSIHPVNYYGGPQYYPDSYYADSAVQNIVGYGPWESYDGVDLRSGAKSAKRAGAAFVETLPTYQWRQRTYKDPQVANETNWEVTIDSGANWSTYCSSKIIADSPPYQDLGGENCDGNENTDHPGLPYPGGVAY